MTLEELEIVVKADITDVTNKLNQLKAQLQDKVQANVQKAVSQIKPEIQSVSTTVASTTSLATKQMEILNKQIELQTQKVRKLKKEYAEEVKYANAYANSGTKNWAEPRVDEARAKYQQAQIQLEKMNIRAEQMRGKLSQTGNEAKKAGEKISRSMKKASADVQKATKHSGKFLQTFSRIIRVMVVRGVINQAIQGFNDLTKASSEYNAVMSNIQASMLQARNSITTAFAPAIQMLEPYLVRFAEIISDLFTKIAMYSSAFAGNNFYYRAKKVTTDYAKSLGKVADEQKRVLAGFDELNVLSENEKGNGATGLPASEDMFEKVDIPQDVLDNVANFKQKLEEILPILEAIGVAIASYKIGELFGLWGKGTGLVSKLTNAFKDKNSALGDQQEEYAKEKSWLAQLVPAFATAGSSALIFGKALQGIELKLPSLEPLVAFQKAFETAKDFIKEKIEGIQQALEGLGNKVAEILPNAVNVISSAIANVLKTFTILKDSATKIFENIKNNFTLFAKATVLAIINWAISIITNTIKTFSNMVESSKRGFEAIQKNANTFVQAVSTAIKLFCYNLSKNVVDTVKNLVESFVSGFRKIWDDFVSLMSGLGETISNWWSENKTWVIPTVVTGLAITAGVALAPYTGGASLGLAALASGGVLTKPTPVLAGEYAGASSNPEIVAPQSLMYETNMKANVPVINAIEEMSDNIIDAFKTIGVYADFGYDKLRVGLEHENYRAGEKLYGI